jgi:hypothetical protein
MYGNKWTPHSVNELWLNHIIFPSAAGVAGQSLSQSHVKHISHLRTIYIKTRHIYHLSRGLIDSILPFGSRIRSSALYIAARYLLIPCSPKHSVDSVS